MSEEINITGVESAGVESGVTKPDLYASIKQQLSLQEERYGTSIIVLADIDDTTYSHKVPQVNNAAYTTILKERDIPDIRVTGRHLHEVLAYINDGKITRPPAVLSVRNGTMIYIAKPNIFTKWEQRQTITEDDYEEDEEYTDRLASLGFDKRSILGTKHTFQENLQKKIPDTWLDNQIADRGENLEVWGMVSDRMQVIFDIEVPESIDQGIAQQEILALAERMYGEYSVVLMDVGPAQQSGMKGIAYGLFLLPPGVGKHTANAYLIEKTGATSACVLGDSLNDSTMLTAEYTIPTYKGVVGDANPLLTAYLDLKEGSDIWTPASHGGHMRRDRSGIGPESALAPVITAHEHIRRLIE